MDDDTQPPSRGVHIPDTSIGAAATVPSALPSDPAVAMPSVSGRVKGPESSSTLRERKPQDGNVKRRTKNDTKSAPAQVDGPDDDCNTQQHIMPTLAPSETGTPNPKWIALALFSGAFAAMNGVFAKLTTSENTVSLATYLVGLLPFIDKDLLTILLRAGFFGLNIASNAVMWILFTRALTSHPSTTKVSVVNTSANFTITAIMGSLVFGEAVGGIGGILGIVLLVGGCVVLGAEEKKDKQEIIVGVDAEAAEALLDEVDEHVDELIDLEDEVKSINRGRPKTRAAILEGTESEEDLVEL